MEIILYILAGHFFMALFLYLNHRFIFHGRLGTMKILKPWKKIHTMHHKNDYKENWKKFALIPWWGWICISAVCCVVGYLTNAFFGIGVFSYFISYEVVHYYLHKHPLKGNISNFHYYHHRKNPKKNFATFYLFIDKAFGTYKK